MSILNNVSVTDTVFVRGGSENGKPKLFSNGLPFRIYYSIGVIGSFSIAAVSKLLLLPAASVTVIGPKQALA